MDQHIAVLFNGRVRWERKKHMFIGHYSAAFAAKRFAPALPLALWFLACQVIDIFWSTFILLGVEKMRIVPNFTASNGLDLYFMPYTHSLPAALVWSLSAALLFWIVMPRSEHRLRNTIILAMVVASHWTLDLLVHIPDLPLWYDSFKVGFGWWNYRTFAFLLELGLLWGAVLLCMPVIGARRKYYVLLALGMSALQVYSLMRQPAAQSEVALQLLASYVVLTFIAWWLTRTEQAR